MRRVLQRIMIPLRFHHYALEEHYRRCILGVTYTYGIIGLSSSQSVARLLPRSRHDILHPPWLIIKDLDAIRHSSSELDEFLVRGIFVHVVVAVLFIVKLDYETVGRIALCMSAAARRIYGNCLYAVTFRAIVLATREGLDVWLLRCWVNALVFEAQHTIARL